MIKIYSNPLKKQKKMCKSSNFAETLAEKVYEFHCTVYFWPQYHGKFINLKLK